MDVLPQVLAALDPDIDSYMSQATFFRPNRRLVNLWGVPLCYVDLDAYRSEYASRDPEGMSLAVRQIHDRRGDSTGVGGGPLGPGPVPEMAVEVPGAPGGTPAVECRAARARLPAGRLRG